MNSLQRQVMDEIEESLDELGDIIDRINALAYWIAEEADGNKGEGCHNIYEWATEIRDLISGNGG